jgi:hypothetical protein
MKAICKKLFFEKCTIGLGIIDQYLTPETKAPLLVVERTLRGVNVVPLTVTNSH